MAPIQQMAPRIPISATKKVVTKPSMARKKMAQMMLAIMRFIRRWREVRSVSLRATGLAVMLKAPFILACFWLVV